MRCINDFMQTKLQSLIEAWTNIFVGYSLALMTQIIIFPFYGMEINFWGNIQIGIVFTGISLVRSYALRRIFNKWHK